MCEVTTKVIQKYCYSDKMKCCHQLLKWWKSSATTSITYRSIRHLCSAILGLASSKEVTDCGLHNLSATALALGLEKKINSACTLKTDTHHHRQFQFSLQGYFKPHRQLSFSFSLCRQKHTLLLEENILVTYKQLILCVTRPLSVHVLYSYKLTCIF